ncbi:unnamed protein product [Phaeothamnion confervicola]
MAAVGGRFWIQGGIEDIAVRGGMRELYISERLLTANCTVAASDAATTPRRRRRLATSGGLDAATGDGSGAAASANDDGNAPDGDGTAVANADTGSRVLGWDEYLPPNARDPGPRFDVEAVAWGGKLVLHGGWFETVMDAADVWLLDVGAVRWESLTMAQPDPTGLGQTPVAFMHLVMAMALIFSFVCLFLSAVRRSMDHRFASSLPMASYHSARGGGGGRNGNGGRGSAGDGGGDRGGGVGESGLTAATIDQLPLVSYANALVAVSGDTCSICLFEFEPADKLRQLPCRHLFHPHCLGPWLLQHGSCPMCKANVRSGMSAAIAATAAAARTRTAAAASARASGAAEPGAAVGDDGDLSFTTAVSSVSPSVDNGSISGGAAAAAPSAQRGGGLWSWWAARSAGAEGPQPAAGRGPGGRGGSGAGGGSIPDDGDTVPDLPDSDSWWRPGWVADAFAAHQRRGWRRGGTAVADLDGDGSESGGGGGGDGGGGDGGGGGGTAAFRALPLTRTTHRAGDDGSNSASGSGSGGANDDDGSISSRGSQIRSPLRLAAVLPHSIRGQVV